MQKKIPIQYTFSEISKGYSNLAVITGSGIDAESGLPTFRGEKGYYEDKETTYLASIDALKLDPIRQWRWYLNRFVSYKDTLPSASHLMLAKLEKKIGEKFLGIITQNISGLHRKAGSEIVFEVHGSIREKRNIITGECKPIPDSWIKSIPNEEELISWRPNVCLIGESYDNFPLNDSIEICDTCEVLLIIGTAGIIHTPVWLAEISKKSGATVININPNKCILDEVSNFVFRGTALQYFGNISSVF